MSAVAMLPSRMEMLSAAGIKGGHAPKHKWTDEDREYLRANYAGTPESARFIAGRLGISFFGVRGQLAKQGLLQQKSPPWTEVEIEKLGDLIHRHPIGQVARLLHRSPNAVKIKATRLKMCLRAHDGWYTKKDVTEILAVDHHKVQAWIDQGLLAASYHNGLKPSNIGSAMWHIEQDDLRTFLRRYPQELQGRNVDLITIVDILAGLDDTNIKRGGGTTVMGIDNLKEGTRHDP